MKRKTVAWMMTAAMLSACLAGCGGESSTSSSSMGEVETASSSGNETASSAGSESSSSSGDSDVVIGATLLTLQDAFYITQKQALEEAAAEHGVEVVIMDAESDVTNQANQVQDMIAMGVDAMIIAPVEPTAAIDMIDECNGAGIPVICNSTDIDAEVAVKVLRDDAALGLECGEKTAEWINENLDGKAKIAMLNCRLYSNTVAWEDGFRQKIEELCPEAEFVAEIEATSRETGMSAMEDVLQSNPDVNVVWGVNEGVGLGALAAIEGQGRDDVHAVFMCGGDQEAFDRLEAKDELLIGFEEIYPYEDGKVSFDAAMKVINGEEVEERIDTIGVWWDEDNYEDNIATYPAYPEGVSVG